MEQQIKEFKESISNLNDHGDKEYAELLTQIDRNLIALSLKLNEINKTFNSE